VPFQVTGIETA